MINSPKSANPDTSGPDMGIGIGRNASAAAIGFAMVAAVAPIFLFSLFPLVGLGAVSGIIAVILVLRSRARGRRGALGVFVLVIGAVAAIADIILTVVMVAMLIGSPLYDFEVRAQGSETFTIDVSYAGGTKRFTEEWSSDVWKKFSTPESSAEIIVTGNGTVSCQILLDGEVVEQESSNGGSVTCRHE